MICHSSGGTKPLFFQWYRNGQTLANGPENEFKIENNDDYSLFTIKNVDRSNSGNYSCVVRNEFGTDIQSALLTVKGLIQLFCYKIWFNFFMNFKFRTIFVNLRQK